MNVAVLHLLAALLLAPLFPGVINRVKARFAGRQGAPLFQLYFDLAKLLKKGAVFSTTSTWLFRAGSAGVLATSLAALVFVPAWGCPSLIHFQGDFILFAYLLGLGRFLTMLAALDTGSAFEGMGASREAFFSALAEPALLLGLAVLAGFSHSLSLQGIYLSIPGVPLPALLFLLVAFGIIFLAENARIPVDDPNTHLELTMIHEVMVLDHSGPDLALIEYAGALRLWATGLLVVGLLPIRTELPLLDLADAIFLLFAWAVVVGVVESSMARLRINRVPLLLGVAFVLSVLSLFWRVK